MKLSGDVRHQASDVRHSSDSKAAEKEDRGHVARDSREGRDSREPRINPLMQPNGHHRTEPLKELKPLVKTSSAIKLTLATSRPKKANVFGNVDDDSPERDRREKKKRDLHSRPGPQAENAEERVVSMESRKRGPEDGDAPTSGGKKPRVAPHDERKGSHSEKPSSAKQEGKSKYSSSKGSATAAAVLAANRAAAAAASGGKDRRDEQKSSGDSGKGKSTAASRREELLKQLKAVEDAIQRKRVKTDK